MDDELATHKGGCRPQSVYSLEFDVRRVSVESTVVDLWEISELSCRETMFVLARRRFCLVQRHHRTASQASDAWGVHLLIGFLVLLVAARPSQRTVGTLWFSGHIRPETQ
jgi:hypothetical protein